jgi:hypothetical protein
MEHIGLDFFTNSGEDAERRQYHVLAWLQNIQQQFAKNRLYPYLNSLIDLHRDLKTFLQNLDDLEERMPKKLSGIDLEKKTLYYEALNTRPGDLDSIRDLIRWALPYIKSAIDEGAVIFEFVDENMDVEKVGIIPVYTEEGYSFISDEAAGKIHIFRYEVSVFESSRDKYRSLKTTLVKTIDTGLALPSLNSIKLDLVRQLRDLPNPATYSIRSGLDFPFNETILPVAKRKLLKHLYC